MTGITRQDALHAEKTCRFAFWAWLAPMVVVFVKVTPGVELHLGLVAAAVFGFACFHYLRKARRTLAQPWVSVMLFVTWPVALAAGIAVYLASKLIPSWNPPKAIETLGVAGGVFCAVAISYLVVLLFQQWLACFQLDEGDRSMFLQRHLYKSARKYTRRIERFWLFGVVPALALWMYIVVTAMSQAEDGRPAFSHSLFAARKPVPWDAYVFAILFIVLTSATLIYYFLVAYVFTQFRALWETKRAVIRRNDNDLDAGDA